MSSRKTHLLRLRPIGVVTLVAISWAMCLTHDSAVFASQLALPLSPGDRVQVAVADDDIFSGRYQIDLEGRVVFPHLAPVHVAGVDVTTSAARVAEALELGEMLMPGAIDVTVQVLSWAPVEVLVEGAVFYPGIARLEPTRPREQGGIEQTELPGGSYPRRFLSDALVQSGGVRPDADLSRVEIHRGDEVLELDIHGYFTGSTVRPVPLAAGDRVFIPSLDVEQSELARPSRITPPGVKIFASNLIVPAESNALASVDPGVTMRYGSRFSQGVVAANCAGGARASNAGRWAVLVRTDRISGATERWESRLEDLLRSETGDDNPILFEGDSIVCYDSRVTNVREVFRTITDILLPFHLGR